MIAKGLIPAAVLLLIAAGFYSGYRVGETQGMRHVFTVTAEVNALNHHNLMTILDAGMVEKARMQLSMIIDGNILEVDAFSLEQDDERERRNGLRILTAIAEHRRHFPAPSYGGEVNRQVSEILNRAVSESLR